MDKLDYKPGTFMLSKEANVAFMDLSNILNRILLANDIRVGNNHLDAPETLEPQLTMTQFFSEFMAIVVQLKKKHELSFLELACVGTITSASFINEYKDATDPRISTGLAVYGFIEGTKTVPPAFPD